MNLILRKTNNMKIIAEIGINHDGILQRAKELIDLKVRFILVLILATQLFINDLKTQRIL